MPDLPLITIWARHFEGWGIPDDCPQFVAAFPTSLREALPYLYREWLVESCIRYGDEVDSPVVAFYSGAALIKRPEDFSDLAALDSEADCG
jgi:hypothetical protein